MLKPREKGKLIERNRTHATDTGSAEVQATILSEEIRRLAGHLKQHPKDNHSRRGLLGMVARRKKLLDYLAKKAPDRHLALARRLGLRRSS